MHLYKKLTSWHLPELSVVQGSVDSPVYQQTTISNIKLKAQAGQSRIPRY